MKQIKRFNGLLVLSLCTLITGFFMMAVPASAVDVQHVAPDELKKMIENKADIVVLDVQPKGAYDIGHVKGAINFPWAQELKGPVKLPKNKTLVFYCDCAHEEDSTSTAIQLIEKWGYSASKIRVLTGGWSGWVKLGYPVEKGKTK
jgi:rhodanese-related sulfurtransferase